jgi:hypothetical protein
LSDQIDKQSLEIAQAPDETYTDLRDLADELPDHSPRYVLLSYPLTLVREPFSSFLFFFVLLFSFMSVSFAFSFPLLHIVSFLVDCVMLVFLDSEATWRFPSPSQSKFLADHCCGVGALCTASLPDACRFPTCCCTICP